MSEASETQRQPVLTSAAMAQSTQPVEELGALRGVVDFQALGERTVYLDCDVLQADGGTRCAAICGGYVAIASAFRRLVGNGSLPRTPLTDAVAAISVGIVDGDVLLDLPYAEDSRAEVDMNVVMTGSGELIEVQATAEKSPFGRASLDSMLELAAGGIGEIVREQERVLDEALTAFLTTAQQRGVAGHGPGAADQLLKTGIDYVF